MDIRDRVDIIYTANSPAEPRLHLADTEARLVKVHILCVLAPHAQGLISHLTSLLLLLELQLCHAVKQLG